MSVDWWFSCDYIFKVLVNIGFWFNKRWVKFYDIFFIVLNEEGIVLSWKFCCGIKFILIDGFLKLLKR